MSKALIIDVTDGLIRPVEIHNLRDMQAAVGGYIEYVSYVPIPGADLIVNEEGLINGFRRGFFINGYGPFWGSGLLLGAEKKDGGYRDVSFDTAKNIDVYFVQRILAGEEKNDA